MKYIKKYEVIRIKPNDELTPQDFIEIKYWRYRNDMIDCIMRLEKFIIEKLDTKFIFKMLVLKSESESIQKHNDFLILQFDNITMKQIIKLEAKHKILRPATEEEIEKFNMMEIAKNYNV